MRVEFSIQAWSAVAPGIQGPTAWLNWAASPDLPSGDLELDLSHLPAMARRRLGRLAKMAVLVADDVLQREQLTDLPIVWASRYGYADKSLGLLREHAVGEPLSPTAFGLAVHNGIGAQHSILRGMVSNAVCVASSQGAPEAGLVEALALLHGEDVPAVLLVCYDAPLPGEYTGFDESRLVEFAWAALITRARHAEDSPAFSLSAGTVAPETKPVDAASLPHGLGVLQFLLDAHQTTHSHGGWTWERLHA